MRLRLLLVIAPLLVVALVVLAPGVAHAKVVPSSATIEGDAMAGPLTVDRTSGPGGNGSTFDRLVEQAGFFGATMALVPDPMLDEAPTADLGPVLEITWQVESHDDATAAGTVRQLVFPDAEGGPLTYTEPGQTVVDGVTAPGGWYRSPATIVGSLDALGVPVDDPSQPAAPTRLLATPDAASSGSPWVTAGAIAAAGLVVGAAVLWSRRRGRMRLTTT